jgi:hypothetical protein
MFSGMQQVVDAIGLPGGGSRHGLDQMNHGKAGNGIAYKEGHLCGWPSHVELRREAGSSSSELAAYGRECRSMLVARLALFD